MARPDFLEEHFEFAGTPRARFAKSVESFETCDFAAQPEAILCIRVIPQYEHQVDIRSGFRESTSWQAAEENQAHHAPALAAKAYDRVQVGSCARR
jgi:hypothetical protein